MFISGVVGAISLWSITVSRIGMEGIAAVSTDQWAVMATAGFTLITEALYLRKPYLALPMRGQFEQELNGFLLAKLKYGANVRRVSQEAVGSFLYRLPDYREQLWGYRVEDNSSITGKLDELLAEGAFFKDYW